MTVRVFASGSGGNSLLLSSADTNIFIDAGISMRRLVRALADTGHTMEKIGGVLITHEHSDHISGLPMLCRHYRLPLYAPAGVAGAVEEKYPQLSEFMHVIPTGKSFQLNDVSVTAFHTPHDAAESVGYRIECEGDVFALGTDMGMVTDEVLNGLMGAETVLIESNHDEQMLKNGPYPYPLKRRILSDHGHLSNERCAALARTLADNGTDQIVLGHLSRKNNTPELAYRVNSEALDGRKARLLVAPVLGCLEVQVKTGAAV